MYLYTCSCQGNTAKNRKRTFNKHAKLQNTLLEIYVYIV